MSDRQIFWAWAAGIVLATTTISYPIIEAGFASRLAGISVGIIGWWLIFAAAIAAAKKHYDLSLKLEALALIPAFSGFLVAFAISSQPDANVVGGNAIGLVVAGTILLACAMTAQEKERTARDDRQIVPQSHPKPASE